MVLPLTQQSHAGSHKRIDWRHARKSWRFFGLLTLAVLASIAVAEPARAGVGCDLNVRVNNHTPNAITVYGASKSSASKSGLNLWSPLTGMVDAVLDPKNSGAASHTKQAVELELPCWTGKVDFRVKYLDGTNEKWKRRDGVSIKSGNTIQINIP